MKKIIMIFAAVLALALVSPVAQAVPGGEVASVKINGLVCDFCARAMEKVFGKREEVATIDVNLTTKIVTIEFNPGASLEDETINKLILDSGYTPVEITRTLENS